MSGRVALTALDAVFPGVPRGALLTRTGEGVEVEGLQHVLLFNLTWFTLCDHDAWPSILTLWQARCIGHMLEGRR